MDLNKYMHYAWHLAREAAAEGEVPVGLVAISPLAR